MAGLFLLNSDLFLSLPYA